MSLVEFCVLDLVVPVKVYCNCHVGIGFACVSIVHDSNSRQTACAWA